MFRVPPSPFSLSKPKLSLPLKSASRPPRRLSNNNKERGPRATSSQAIPAAAEVEERALESDGGEELKYIFHTASAEKDDSENSNALSRPTKTTAQNGRRPTGHVQEFITGKQDDTFTSAQPDPASDVVLNSHFIHSSEDLDVSDNESPSRRKRKQPTGVIDTSESIPKKHKKRRKSTSKLIDLVDDEADAVDVDRVVSRLELSPEKSLFGMSSEGQALSKKERKELKRLRKEERQKRREERAEWRRSKQATKKPEREEDEVGSENEEPNSKTLNDIPSSYQPTAALSQEIPLDQSSGKPSRKKKKQRNFEIAATQELPLPAPSSIRHSSPEGTPLPEPKRRSLLSVKNPAIKKKSKKPSQPAAIDILSDAEQTPAANTHGDIGEQKAAALSTIASIRASAEEEGLEREIPRLESPGSSPKTLRGKRRRQVSNQRIYDSSADEEQPPPVTVGKKRKVGDLAQHHRGQQAHVEEVYDGSGHGEFTSEEDARLKQVISQYQKREDVTDEDFLEQLRGKREDAEFMVDVNLEEWDEDRTPAQLFRRVQYLYNITPPQPPQSSNSTTSGRRTSSNTKLYAEHEDVIITDAVRGYLQLEKITKEEFAALLETDAQMHYSKRKSRDFLKDLAQQLSPRSVLSVTRHLMKLYPVEQYEKVWTLEDDTKLKKLVALHGKQWTKIAPELSRSPEIVRLRYKDYTSWGEKRNKGGWNEDEIWRFNEAVVERLGELGREMGGWQRKGREEVSRMFDWNGVSEKVKTRSRLQCRSRWIQLGLPNDKEE